VKKREKDLGDSKTLYEDEETLGGGTAEDASSPSPGDGFNTRANAASLPECRNEKANWRTKGGGVWTSVDRRRGVPTESTPVLGMRLRDGIVGRVKIGKPPKKKIGILAQNRG